MLLLMLILVVVALVADPETTTLASTETATTTTGATTAEPPLTTEKPPPTQTWHVTDNNYTCILFQAKMRIITPDNTSHWVPPEADVFNDSSSSHPFPIPVSACNYNETTQKPGDDQILTLTWSLIENESAYLTFYFSTLKNHTSVDDNKRFNMYRVVHFHGENQIFDKTLDANQAPYASPGQPWFCKVDQNYSMDNDYKLEITDTEIMAFAANKTSFGNDPHYCSAMNTSNDLVPIIVGACLAALVIFVLVAYLVGRARAKRNATGYESV